MFIDLIDLFFSENQQESILKNQIGRFCSVDFNAPENEKLFKQLLSYYNASKGIIKTLNLIINMKQEE